MRSADERSPEGIEIKALRKSDAGIARQIALLGGSVWGGKENEPELAKSTAALEKETANLDADTKVLLVASRSGELIGFCRFVRDQKALSRWWLAGIEVRPTDRRRGIGRSLVAAGIEYARGRGCVLLQSEAHVDNGTSISFHEAVGFSNDGPFTALDGDEKMAFSLPLEEPPFEVVPLRAGHLPDAAALFTAGYRAARRREPLLPARHEDAQTILPKLQQLAEIQPGVAAFRSGRLVGFLLGQGLPDFRGHRSIYVPEWAHAAAGADREETCRAMYAALSPDWLADGCFSHLTTTFACDREATEAWFRLGFGMIAVDAIRDLGPVAGVAADVDIRRAGMEDADDVLRFARGIQRHMAETPMFVAGIELVEMETIRRRLADPAQAIFLACRNKEPAAFIHIGPANPSAAYVVQDEKTASIRGLFTKPSHRGKGIGTALLTRAIDRARSAGYGRCAVDFEPQNIPGSRFWLTHFRPVCYSMIRHVDEQIGARRRA